MARRFLIVQRYLRSTTLAGKAALALEAHGLIEWHVRQYQPHILLPNKPVLVKVVDVECELDLGLNIGVVDLEEAVHELLEVDVAVTVEVEHSEEPLTYDTWQLRILHTQMVSKGWLMESMIGASNVKYPK
jgi:hypothetical protein